MSLRIIIQGDGKASGKTELLRVAVSAMQKAGYAVKMLPYDLISAGDIRVSEIDKLEDQGLSYTQKTPCPFTEEGISENDGREVSIIEMNKPPAEPQ